MESTRCLILLSCRVYQGHGRNTCICYVSRLPREYWVKGRNLMKDSYLADDLFDTPEAARNSFFV